jgi:AAHS family 4-hydroxybenzoate transporter-like MFS transporter
MFVSIMFAGFGLGAVAGGLLASRLIPAYGWQAAFWIGGIGPLMMLPIVWAFMPESATFLAGARKRPDRIADILRRMDPRTIYSPDQTFVLGEKPEKAGTVSNLFAGDRTAGTLLLWLIQFCTIFANSLVASWLPAIMTRAGMPLDVGILGTVMMQLGGVIGTISLGLLIDRLGATTLIAVAYALGAIATFLIGQVIGPAGITLVTIFVAGFLMVASQFCMNTVLAAFYPTKIRSTGVGWALGIGRFGAVLGPFLGGAMLSSGWAVATVFLSVAAAAVIAAAATVALGVMYPDQRRPIPRERRAVAPE